MEWQRRKDDLCGGCGHPRSESFGIGNHDAYVGKPLFCHACAARDHDSKKWQDAGGETAGLYMGVTKIPSREG